ncbi:MAG TPA: 30S ribosomal protein S21 [Tenericutes bacterium]|nr:30S ribosomal protein S21 [Mycoplasmatota bacterium]
MSQVKIRKGESVDDALRRFNRKVALNGNLAEARKREYYERPGIRRRKKREEAIKRQRKNTRSFRRNRNDY